MTAPPPKPPPRWLRFSLRSLLLAAFLCGSAGMLWRNWPLWRAELNIDEGAPVDYAGFSADGALFATCVILSTERAAPAPANTATPRPEVHRFEFRIRESSTGKLVRSLKPDGRYGYASLSFESRLNFVSVNGTLESESAIYLWRKEIWRLDSGEKFPSDLAIRAILDERHGVVSIDGGSQNALVRLSDKTRLAVFLGYPTCSSDGKWCAYRNVNGDTLNLFNLHDETLAGSLKFSRRVRPEAFSPDGKRLLVEYEKADETDAVKILRIPELATEWEGAGEYRAVSKDWTHLVTGVTVTPRAASGPYHATVSCWRIGANTPLWTRTLQDCEAKFSDDGARIFLSYNYAGDPAHSWVLDAQTGAEIWSSEKSGCGEWAEFNGRFVYCPRAESGLTIVDPAGGLKVFQYSRLRTPGAEPGKKIEICQATNNILTIHENRVVLWRQSRPVRRFDLLYMPEFWITLLLAGALVWSLHRDRRIGRPA